MRTPAHTLALCLLLLLSACATRLPEPAAVDWESHSAAVAELQTWQLGGRLNVLQNRQSDTVTLNWSQQDSGFDLNLSGTLGLGAVHVYGTPSLVTVEKSGEAPLTLPGLAALTQEYFGFEFPAAQLLYWVRGIPDPALPAATTFDASQLLATLEQRDPAGQVWVLTYDRYQAVGALFLPGRIRVQREGLRLTFLIDAWTLPEDLAASR